LLSPAKSLDFETPLPDALPHTLPAFAAQARELVERMREFSPQDLASLMHISDALAALNVGRFATFHARASAAHARQALFAFNGDVYDGLDVRSLAGGDIAWAQEHLAILSGLYGVLRPLDWMQPYRLEMGTRLATDRGTGLYAWWGERIARHLDAQLQQHGGEPLLLNLASQEYFKAVDRKALRARVAECVFEDWHADTWKVMGFHAKRARGRMARFAITQRATSLEALHAFNVDGYAYAAAASSPERLVFRRRRT
ncbi:MAG: peroxide stress protein YaaA, partial [Giesbergeria sp.]